MFCHCFQVFFSKFPFGAPDLARAYQGLTKIWVEIISGRELAPDTGVNFCRGDRCAKICT